MPGTPIQRILDLAPSRSVPRRSEGAFADLPDGRLLFAYTRFTGGKGDGARADLAYRVSADQGKSFGDEQTLLSGEGRRNIMSVSLLWLDPERLGLFYLVKNGFHDCRPRLRILRLPDLKPGRPILAAPPPGYLVLNNDRVVRLASGRIIVPCAYHRRKGKDPDNPEHFDPRGTALFFLSDDGGKSFREADTTLALPCPHSGTGLQEPGVVELVDQRLFAWARTDLGCQFGSYSFDSGETWSLPQPTVFQGPTSACSLKRIPATGDLLAVWNDHDARHRVRRPTMSSWGRTPLVAALSRDEGVTWGNHRLIEKDPRRGFCYTALHFTRDHHVLLAYCAGGKADRSVLARLRVSRVPIEFLY